MILEKSLYDFFIVIFSMGRSMKQWIKACIWSQETDLGSASCTWLTLGKSFTSFLSLSLNVKKNDFLLIRI